MGRHYMNVVNSYLMMIMNYDYETYSHSLRVASMAKKIGNKMDLNYFELNELGISALLHDIGKIKVPKKILNKPAKLNALEWDEIFKHPGYGVEILQNKDKSLSPNIIESVYCHHEFYNGQGYPRGIEKDAIPFYARIISIADALDSMVTKRNYRKNELSIKNAIKEVKQNSGSQFDPNIVEKLYDLY